ncbi:hypothetical protein D0861_05600 [Hortaea werneckii]|uniref:Exocyst complex component Sec8 n=1 Tax=Hortaea werneckii TaxID=91943 RepID=A0A3M7FDU0_HORWE|nr:hypothetical protein D0861_05600 [Hortaea werneckii]
MSYMRNPHANGSASHLNGNGAGSRFGRFDVDATPDTSADERSRSRGPGGYGGFGGHDTANVRGPARVERQRAQRRSRDYGGGWDSSRSRSRPAASRYGAAGSQVEEVLRFIQSHYPFMASSECIPIKTALQLMDDSSLGLADQYDQFTDVHQQLQNALKTIVNEHHQGFNSSIGTFHKIQNAIANSQHRVRTLRSGLLQAKGSLGTAGRPELRAFATSSQSYDSMLQVLGEIEQLQAVPERLEAQISEKRFLDAVGTLQDALSLIRKPEMEDIGALSDLRVYLSNQEHSLTDILVEELHSHLYLKSPYCEERWKSLSQRADDSAVTAAADEERAMYSFLENYDGRQPMQEDTTRNPEANTFYYIQLLVESLNKMMKLDVAVDAIEHRLPVELFRVVERSHTEVEQRHPTSMRSAAAKSRQQALRGSGAGGLDGEQKATLEDLLTTLYAKFEAIAEGHRVLHDVTAAILKREAQADAATLNRSFRELWKLLQSEIRSLLHDHLATSGSIGGQRSNQTDSSANIFRPKPRDRTRKLFKLTDADSKSTALTTEREDLEFILKASVPGLVNTSAQQLKKESEGIEDHALPDRSATGHKFLVEPSVFNMSTLLPPSLTFLTRLRDIVPPNSGVVQSTLTSFLDDFLINVFHPQLDETLLDLTNACMTADLEAFQAAPDWQVHCPRPVFKGTIRFYEVIKGVCEMLCALPHEQSFSKLVIDQMHAYYDRCFEWSKSLLQRALVTQPQQGGDESANMRLAALLATQGDINDCVIQLLNAQKENNEKDSEVLAEKESALLIQQIKGKRIEEADMINDRKSLAALCTLQVSMKWLAARCKGLRFVSPRAIDMLDTADTQQSSTHHSRRWTRSQQVNAPSTPYLPLDQQRATEFDAVLASFTELSTLVLRTLQIDLRLHLLRGIYKAMDTTYVLSQPYNDPDSAILALSTDLSSYDAAISAHLLPAQYSLLTQNLDVLVNNSLCSLVGCIQGMDEHGNSRMQLNVLVLQQSLKNVESRANLERAARFYELAEQGPAAVVERGPAEGYEGADLKALVRLCWVPERDAEQGSVEEWVARLG